MRARMLTITALALGLVGVAVTPAHASSGARHCVLNIATGSMTCVGSTAEAARVVAATPRAITLVRFWDGYNQDRNTLSLTVTGPACSASTTDIDVGWTSLGPLAGITSSVGRNADGHCNWQLRGAGGATSTWVAVPWDNLATLGGGWDNRAVEFRLT